MITDKLPRNKLHKEEYLRSNDLRTINLPPMEPLRTLSVRLRNALSQEDLRLIQLESNAISAAFAAAYAVKAAKIKVLGARPHRVTETSSYELFGDYTLETACIRLWMRTAIIQKPTSFGTLLSTLCHELCHHLDVVSWGFPNTFHTRGFYERAALLYHHVRGTPVRQLVWVELAGGCYRINWAETMRNHG